MKWKPQPRNPGICVQRKEKQLATENDFVLTEQPAVTYWMIMLLLLHGNPLPIRRTAAKRNARIRAEEIIKGDEWKDLKWMFSMCVELAEIPRTARRWEIAANYEERSVFVRFARPPWTGNEACLISNSLSRLACLPYFAFYHAFQLQIRRDPFA